MKLFRLLAYLGKIAAAAEEFYVRRYELHAMKDQVDTAVAANTPLTITLDETQLRAMSKLLGFVLELADKVK